MKLWSGRRKQRETSAFSGDGAASPPAAAAESVVAARPRPSLWRRLLGRLDGTAGAEMEYALRTALTEQERRLRAEADARVREAMSAGLTRDDQQLQDGGFRLLTTGSGTGTSTRVFRELLPLQQDRMLRLVFWLWERNPLARWLVNTVVDFTLGEDAHVETDAPDVREVVERFWNDPVNQLSRRLDTWAMEFGLYGELCLPVFVNEMDGHVRLGYVDPLEIAEVITDPNNVLITLAVRLKASAGGVATGPRLLKVVREETNRASAFYGRLIPAMPGEYDPVLQERYDGACLLWQTNKVSNGRRGRSDILPLIDWLDGYDATLFDFLDSAQQFNSFFWDVTLNGMDGPAISKWLAENGGPMKRGMIRAHNERVAWKEVTPDLKAVDKNEFFRILRGHIMGSQSFPEHWYGQAGDVNLASAKEMGLTPVKRLTRRQKDLRYVISDLVRFQLHQKMRLGLLKPEVVLNEKVDAQGNSQATTKQTDQAFSVVLPELSMKDQAAIVASTVSLTAALMQAQAEGWIRPETAAKLFAAQVSQLGLPITSVDELGAVQPVGGEVAIDYERLPRLLAQLQRYAAGNGDNMNQPKSGVEPGGVPRTVPVAGATAA